MKEKTCTNCGQTKVLDLFPKAPKMRDGHASWCKACKQQKVKEFHANNPGKAYQYTKGWNASHPDKIKANGKKSKLKRKYGLTEQGLEQMKADHNNQCAICSHPFSSDNTDRMNRYNVDHCHATNLVRGLLCTRCNTVLGKINDDPGLLQLMITYLKQSLN